MGSRPCLAGMEVPIIGSDSVNFVQLTVPPPTSAPTPAPPITPITRDVGSCSIIRNNPPTYFIWKICRNRANVLEMMELCANDEFPKGGLQIVFPEALLPYALVCKNEMTVSSVKPYLLHAVTVSGVAYVIKLEDISNYVSSSHLRSDDFVEFNTLTHPNQGATTAVAGTEKLVVAGRSDGSVGCFQLGILEHQAPVFVQELRDDASIGRLWGVLTRARSIAAVQDLVISEFHQKKLLFVLHSDGSLRVWDLLNHSRIFSHSMIGLPSAGSSYLRIWVENDQISGDAIPLAVLQKDDSVGGTATISICCLNFSAGDRINLLLDPLTQNISLEESQGDLIDVKLTTNKLWILKEDGLVVMELFGHNRKKELAHCYSLQDAFVSEQLFQGSENSVDDLLWVSHTVLSSSKDQISPFVSSVFLRRLLLPGVYHRHVLRVTLKDFNKHFTDSEFDSLTVDGLKSEMLSVIQNEVGADSPISLLHSWKMFCTRYFNNWCTMNLMCGLLIDSAKQAVGVIRRKSVSMCRSLEDIELLVLETSDANGNIIRSRLDSSDSDLEWEILLEVIKCVNNLSQHLGKASSAIFYESLLRTPNSSSEEVIPRFLKTLESGHNSLMVALHVSELGTDVALEKEISYHKRLRKFSVDMFLSLHSLSIRATGWGRALHVIVSYLKFLVPRKYDRKYERNLDSEGLFTVNTALTVQAISQISKVMFESALDVHLLLSYMVNSSSQIGMSEDDVSRVKLELVPMIQEVLTEWHIIHFFSTTPSESLVEDFSTQLSSLQLNGNVDPRSWNEKLGKSEFTLAFILLLRGHCGPSFRHLPDPSSLTSSVQQLSSWILWGKGAETSFFFSHSIDLALMLLRHGQYDAVEYVLSSVDTYSRKEKISQSLQSNGGEWSTLLHLLGCCFIAQTQRGLHGTVKERKISEAIRCFFRAASVEGAAKALQSLPNEAGWLHLGFSHHVSPAAWKLHYYEWAMQIFERHSMREAACQFALAGLEQVDEALGSNDESATAVKGRLWENVFQFTLDLNHYHDAYCAIISNPDEEGKAISLRRFINVLYERGTAKILCDGQLPFVGLSEKVERELASKAERSDVSAKPNLFKLLYAFAMQRHNWRRAASYIYLYSAQLRVHGASKDPQRRTLILQERLSGLSAAINALQLVHPAYAWIDAPLEETCSNMYPSKKARIIMDDEQFPDSGAQSQRRRSYVDVEKLENEFILTSAEYLLSLTNVKWTFTRIETPPTDVIDLLVESNLYDMAFTVILKFWKGSSLKREIERILVAMSLKCCQKRPCVSSVGNGQRMQSLLLTSSQDEIVVHESPNVGPVAQGNSHWEMLELYLGTYIKFHAGLPVVVADTLLAADPQMELPLWLVQMFKGVPAKIGWGMAGSESNPASLFRLYIDYGRYTEATNMLLEYIESFASLRPADIVRRKRPFAVWFPYSLIERLWCQLQQSIKLGHMIDQSEKLKRLLQGALMNHLHQLKVDSDDVLSSASHQNDVPSSAV